MDSSRITSAVTKESVKEEKPVLTFMTGKSNLTAVITAIILTGLIMVYIFLRVIRVKETKKKR